VPKAISEPFWQENTVFRVLGTLYGKTSQNSIFRKNTKKPKNQLFFDPPKKVTKKKSYLAKMDKSGKVWDKWSRKRPRDFRPKKK